MFREATALTHHPLHHFRKIFLVIGASFLISLVGQFSIPLPFTPVPLSLRPQMIMLLGFLLGTRQAVLAVILFLVQAVSGISLFAGAVTGIAGIIGPSGGYCIGFILAAYITGRCKETMNGFSLKRILLSILIATLVIYSFGVLRLTHFVGFQKAILLGVCPFLIGDFFKSILIVKLVQKLIKD